MPGSPTPGPATNLAGLSLAELETWRARLNEARDAINAANAAAGGSADTVELDQAKVGRLSRMDALQIQAMARADAQRRAQQLQKIALAIIRIDAGVTGDYGLCRACEEPVNPRRLLVDPATPLCIDCASAA